MFVRTANRLCGQCKIRCHLGSHVSLFSTVSSNTSNERQMLAHYIVSFCLLLTSASAATFTIGFLGPLQTLGTDRTAALTLMATQHYAGLAAAIKEANDNIALGVGNNIAYVWEEVGDSGASLQNVGATAIRNLVNTKRAQAVFSSFMGGRQALLYCTSVGIPLLGAADPDVDFMYGTTAVNAIHIRHSPFVEIAAMLNYAIKSRLRCHRFGLAVEAAGMVPQEVLRSLQQQFTTRGLAPPEIAVLNAATLAANASLARDFFLGDFQPQCVFIIGGTNVLPVIAAAQQVPGLDTNAVSFFVSSFANSPQWSSGGSSAMFRNVYLAVQYPHHDDTTYSVVQRFQLALQRYLLTGPTAPFGNLISPSPSPQSLEGYITGRLMIDALARNLRSLSPSTLINTVYDTKFFVLDDFVLGPYGRTACSASQQALTPSSCFCNAGAKQIWIHRVDGSTGYTTPVSDDASLGEVEVARLTTELSSCSPEVTQVTRPYLFAATTSASPSASEQLFLSGLQAALLANRRRATKEETTIVDVLHLASGVSPAQAITTVSPIGFAPIFDKSGFALPPIDTAVLEMPSLELYELQDSSTEGWRSGNISVMPVLADYIHALAAFVSTNTTTASVRVIAQSAEQLFLAEQSINTFQLEVSASTIADSNTALHSAMQIAASAQDPTLIVHQDCNALLSGFNSITTPTTATFAVATTEHCIDQITAGVSNAAVLTNVHFSSVLREWWSPNAKSSNALLSQYGEDFSSTTPSASTMLGLRLADFLITLASRLESYERSGLLDTLYNLGTVATTETSIGPLRRSVCGGGEDPRDPRRECQCSKGPRTFHVHNVRQKVDRARATPASLFTYRMVTCGVEYLPLEREQSRLGLIIAIAIIATVLAIAIAGFIVVTATRKTRDNAAAPKNEAQPFAVVFTDIQSSTSLWARIPEIMSAAVETHHSVIRESIRRHHGYEVKTIGDSFMVAFVDPKDALQFSAEIQTTLFQNEWRGDAAVINETYAELLREKREKEGQVLDDDQISINCWNGIRVRVGMHFGKGQIKHDIVTLGYDYYGTVVNTAARVEGVGHGGQILITDEAFFAVSGGKATLPELSMGLENKPLGAQPLRGLPAPVELYQILPSALNGRKFDPLRLDVENAVPEDGTTSVRSSNRSKFEPTTTAAIAEAAAARCAPMPQAVAYSNIMQRFNYITAILSTSTPDMKKKVVEEWASRWGVPNRKAGKDATPEQQEKLLMEVIAKSSVGYEEKRRKANDSSQESGSRHSTSVENV